LADIFISYAHGDVATAGRFAESFEREGFSVWWDASLRSGDTFDATIEAALRSAKVVVVLWSANSVQSRWVRAEATLADRNKTLMPVMIELCERPIIFELTHAADLSHWNGDPNDAVWRSYLSGLRRFIEAGGPSPGSTAENRQPITRVKETAATIGSPERLPSIAVLPFANLSGDKEQEYFSDGLAEDIINALAQISGLRVIARTSAFAFKGQNTDIRRIAETLGVASILEGSVRRSGNRIRVTAQLITATDGSHQWSERYDREVADVFAVQDEISAAISKALQVRLSQQPAARGQGALYAAACRLRSSAEGPAFSLEDHGRIHRTGPAFLPAGHRARPAIRAGSCPLCRLSIRSSSGEFVAPARGSAGHPYSGPKSTGTGRIFRGCTRALVHTCGNPRL